MLYDCRTQQIKKMLYKHHTKHILIYHELTQESKTNNLILTVLTITMLHMRIKLFTNTHISKLVIILVKQTVT